MRLRIYILLITLFALSSCGDSSNEDASKKPTEQVPYGAPFTRVAEESSHLIIAHDVSDYAVWKATFDLAESVRLKYGITTNNVYQGSVDSNLAVVSTTVTNIDTAKHYLNSDKLYRSMEMAGVIGEIKTFYLNDKLLYAKEVNDTILMFMSFKVIDYQRWEDAFLKDYGEGGSNQDFEVLRVMQGVEEKDKVAMLFLVNDPDYVEKMEKNSSFRMKMISAGVISYPVIYKLEERVI